MDIHRYSSTNNPASHTSHTRGWMIQTDLWGGDKTQAITRITLDNRGPVFLLSVAKEVILLTAAPALILALV